MAFVPDASIAGAWLLPDEAATLAEEALDRPAHETACVPGLFWDEVRSLRLTAERRGRIGQGYADASLARMRRLPFRSPGDPQDHHILELARSHDPTACDASYLALAVREGCPLVSLDNRLGRVPQRGVAAASPPARRRVRTSRLPLAVVGDLAEARVAGREE